MEISPTTEGGGAKASSTWPIPCLGSDDCTSVFVFGGQKPVNLSRQLVVDNTPLAELEKELKNLDKFCNSKKTCFGGQRGSKPDDGSSMVALIKICDESSRR